MATINATPGELDLRVWAGDALSFTALLKVDGVAQGMPDTGWSARIYGKDGVPFGDITVDTSQASSGIVTFTVPDTLTAILPHYSKWEAESQGRTWLAGDIITYFGAK